MSKQSIPQCNPGAGYAEQKEEIDQVVKEVLASGWYILGKQVEQFENKFTDFLGFGYCLGVANGTDAISVALRTLGISEGDHVLTVAHTAVATVAAIRAEGAIPVLADISSQDYNLDLDRVEDWLQRDDRPSVKAMVLVHLYGQSTDVARARALCDQYEMILIEDCAQAHGAQFEGKTVGSFGAAATFSFYPTKNLGAIGDAGGVIFQQPEHMEKARALRQYGWKERYVSDLHGFNSRLDDLQAGVLSVKLEKLAQNNAHRQNIARRYLKEISNPYIEMPWVRNLEGHVFHQFVVRSKRRDELQQFLRNEQVGTLIHYPVPIHQQNAYADSMTIGPMTETERAATEVLSLPMFPEMTDSMVDQVIETVNRFS